MRHKLNTCYILIALAVLLMGCSLLEKPFPTPEVQKQSEYETQIKGQVIRVADGDTFTIKLKDKEERVRLLLVDSPESVHPDIPKPQPHALEASDYAKRKLLHKQVELELGIEQRDKYDRLLAYVYVDGRMFNEMLLEKGLARVRYVKKPNTKYLSRLLEVQQDAKRKKIGIWADNQ